VATGWSIVAEIEERGSMDVGDTDSADMEGFGWETDIDLDVWPRYILPSPTCSPF
jgi:hypothetical protein